MYFDITVVGDEDLENYGLFAGATYNCDVTPETYAEYLYDFLNSIDQLECNLFL